MLSTAPTHNAAALAFTTANAVKTAGRFLAQWANFFRSLWSSESKMVSGRNNFGIAISGPFFGLFLPCDGSVILDNEGGGRIPICCRVLSAESVTAAEGILNEAKIEPISGPVIARIEYDGSMVDFRSGLAMADAGNLGDADFRALMLSNLPLPPELEIE